MTALMSETLSNKESIIKALEKELDDEVHRKKAGAVDFKSELKEIELDKKAVDDLKTKSDKLERR